MSAEFQTTRWTLVLDAAQTGAEASRAALEQLCRHYWPPLNAYVRRFGVNEHDAEDMTQAFFAYLLARNLPAHASAHLGRFRTFLLTSLRNFMHTEHRNATAQKRGGPALAQASIDDEEAGMASQMVNEETPERAYDRKWAHTLINICLDRLADEQAGPGQRERFAAVRPMLLDVRRGEPAQSEELKRLGMTDGAIRTLMSRLRARFRVLVRAEVAHLVDDPAEIDIEIAYLLQAMRPS